MSGEPSGTDAANHADALHEEALNELRNDVLYYLKSAAAEVEKFSVAGERSDDAAAGHCAEKSLRDALELLSGFEYGA